MVRDEEMKIVITITEEPLYINPFISEVIEKVHSDISKIYIVEGSIVRGESLLERISYLITISLISGIWNMLKRGSTIIAFNILELIPFSSNPLSISSTAEKFDIPVEHVDDVQSEEFITDLKEEEPTILINQAQVILTEDVLSIPKIGCLNRHFGLLPKYRGLLAPFWTFLNGEDKSGVSIHFMDEKIDNGPILVQKKTDIERFDTFNSILEKNFELAPEAMVEAIEMIREGDYKKNLIPNPEEEATYYSKPSISDALQYRKLLLSRWLHGK